jgi:hypothetical protein
MDTAADLLHSIAPAGSVMTKKFSENSALKKGDYRVDIALGDLIEGIPDGTVMAMRGIRLRGSSRFTAVGCFSSVDAVPGDDVIRLLIEGQEQRLPSRRPFKFRLKSKITSIPTPPTSSLRKNMSLPCRRQTRRRIKPKEIALDQLHRLHLLLDQKGDDQAFQDLCQLRKLQHIRHRLIHPSKSRG